MKGELKIPGFSSYLHPLAANLILGVGQESGKVKLSLFDASNPSDPKELDKYQLDEYWTDVSSTHHAFLQDKDHGVFFLPGGNNGYIFSYKDNKLKLEKAVSNIQAKRALYINDIMYIVGSDKIVTVDEKTWERIGEMEL
ncbi:MAG: beta-propeller domain-containing protein [Candidatus Doudnabacteria bacterium]|nr:beta-propeller domain-containing protein [Candidatus Doudnabacteria bacterium]